MAEVPRDRFEVNEVHYRFDVVRTDTIECEHQRPRSKRPASTKLDKQRANFEQGN